MFFKRWPKKVDAGDINKFNEKFIAGNKELAKGNTEGLNNGIDFFIESMPFAGQFRARMESAIQVLYGALSRHDRANRKGPWNIDGSGYGVMCWKHDLYRRDDALQRAWTYIESINRELISHDLGWRY